MRWFILYIMRCFKPSDLLLRKRKRTRWEGITIFFYQAWLKFLVKRYKQCAISKIVKVGNEDTWVYEVRDFTFENELLRNGIDIKPKLVNVITPCTVEVAYRPKYARWFQLQSMFTLYVNNKKITVFHANDFSISGDLKAKIKVSIDEDIICRSIIQIDDLRTEINDVKSRKQIQNNTKPTKKSGLFSREAKELKENEVYIETQEAIPSIEKPNVVIPKPIEKKGFTIDTSF